jgi:hypothetical protein
MPGSGNKGDRGPAGGGGMGGSSNAGAGRGGPEGGSSRNNISGGMSPASHKGDTVSGGGHSAYGPRMGYAGYSNVTGQERMARIGDRLASTSMSGFANGTSSGAAPTGIGGGFGPGQGPSGARAAQIGRDAFAAAQRAAVAGGLGFGSPARAAPRVAPRPTVISRPPVTVAPIAPPAPTLTQLQSMYAAPALTSPNLAMNPSTIGVMAPSQVPGYSAPAPAAPNPNIGYADPGTLSRPAPNPATNIGTAPMGGFQSSTKTKSGPQPGDIGYVGGVTSSERGLMAGKSIGTPGSQAGYAVGRDSPPSNPAKGPDRAPAAPGLPGSAGDTGTMGVPGGVQARGTGSPASRGVPGRPGTGLSVGGYADAGSRFGANTGLVGGYRGSGDIGDPGVQGVQGGLAGRGSTQAQALAKSAMDSSWGQASPTQAGKLMARAVKGQLGPAVTAALATAQSIGFSPGSMMAVVSSMSKTANLNFTKGWQAQNMDPRVQSAMNELAKILGISDFNIVSGYRSPSYNAALAKKSKGVAKKSQHMKGTAVDVSYPANVKTEAEKEAFARAMRQAGFTGIGYYGGWVHGDLGPSRGWGDTSSRDAIAKGIAGGK